MTKIKAVIIEDELPAASSRQAAQGTASGMGGNGSSGND